MKRNWRPSAYSPNAASHCETMVGSSRLPDASSRNASRRTQTHSIPQRAQQRGLTPLISPFRLFIPPATVPPGSDRLGTIDLPTRRPSGPQTSPMVALRFAPANCFDPSQIRCSGRPSRVIFLSSIRKPHGPKKPILPLYAYIVVGSYFFN